MASEALTVVAPEAVALVRDPLEVLGDAQRAAAALMQVVGAKKNKVEFNGEQYLENEDWQTIATFHGCTVDVEWTRPVSFQVGERVVSGWEARAVLKDRTGRVLSHAESMCLNDEARWSARPRYAWCYVLKSGGHSEADPGPDEIVWEKNPFSREGKSRPKKERLQVGVEEVPMFQLRSMAQTRASSKVMSTVFRWVVQLAGYRGTPAEEMDGLIDRAHRDAPPLDEERGAPAPARNVTPVKANGNGHAGVIDAETGEDSGGSVTVVDVVDKQWTDQSGTRQPMWEVSFSTGRVATAFDEPVAALAKKAKAEGLAVEAVLEESKKSKGRYKVSELRLVG